MQFRGLKTRSLPRVPLFNPKPICHDLFMTWVMTLFSFALGGLTVFVLGVALWFFLSQRFTAEPAIRPFFSQNHSPSVGAYLNRMTAQMTEIGFVEEQDAVWADGTTEDPIYLRLFRHPDRSTLGIATVRTHSALPDENLWEFFEFQTRFENGKELSTHNSPQLSAPLLPKNYTVLGLNRVKDPVELFAVHQKIIRARFANVSPQTPEGDNLLDHWREAFLREVKSQEEPGGLFLDPQLGVYRPTFTGAVLTIGSSVWPSVLCDDCFTACVPLIG